MKQSPINNVRLRTRYIYRYIYLPTHTHARMRGVGTPHVPADVGGHGNGAVVPRESASHAQAHLVFSISIGQAFKN